MAIDIGGRALATRPVFIATSNKQYVAKENVEFVYYKGFADSQKKKSIASLHESYLKENVGKKVLEISSISNDELGIKLSAFNLMVETKSGNKFSVESAFQSSKVFENGGPYKDLLYKPSRQAKKDERLKNSGKIVGFSINGLYFDPNPKTYFYNWLYINALHLNKELREQIVHYDAFTDIAFNPQKSINCQAEAAAIYVSLQKQGLLQKALENKDSFLKIVYPHFQPNETINSSSPSQISIFDKT